MMRDESPLRPVALWPTHLMAYAPSSGVILTVERSSDYHLFSLEASCAGSLTAGFAAAGYYRCAYR